jgi:glycosyltransferase involved in cell wall biosynthesis
LEGPLTDAPGHASANPQGRLLRGQQVQLFIRGGLSAGAWQGKVEELSRYNPFLAFQPFLDDSCKPSVFLKRKHINIKYIFQKNQGLPSARNTGISLSTGSYITFLDSDDEYKENHLSSRFKILQENPDIDLLHGGVEIIGDAYVPDKNNPSQLIHLDDCMIGGTFFIKRELFQKIGYFRQIDYADDTDFIERAFKSNLNIFKTDIKTYIYHRDSPDSMCNILKNREL